jgi:hypothetical protein
MPRRNPKKMRGKSKLIDVIYDPVANRLTEALDPDRASGRPTSFREMTPEKQAEILAKYRRK